MKASVLTINTDHAFLELFKSDAISLSFLRVSSMLADLSAFAYPPYRHLLQTKRTRRQGRVIVLKKYGERRSAADWRRSISVKRCCVYRRLYPGGQIKLAQNMLHMNLDGGLSNAEVACDQLVAFAQGDTGEHFALTSR